MPAHTIKMCFFVFSIKLISGTFLIVHKVGHLSVYFFSHQDAFSAFGESHTEVATIRPLVFVLECGTDSSGLYFAVLQSRAGSLQCVRTAPGVGVQLPALYMWMSNTSLSLSLSLSLSSAGHE